MPDFIPAAFLSYAHSDNHAARDRITDLADELACEVENLTGEQFQVLYDRELIEWGDNWRARVEGTLGAVTILIPVFTERYFKSAECLRELLLFTRNRAKLGLANLILPLYWEDYDLLDRATKGETAPLLEQIKGVLSEEATPQECEVLVQLVTQCQYDNWRELHSHGPRTPQMRVAIRALAERISEVLEAQDRIDVVIPVGPLEIDERKMPSCSGIKLLAYAGNRQIGDRIFGQLARIGHRIEHIYLLMSAVQGSQEWELTKNCLVNRPMGDPSLSGKIEMIPSGGGYSDFPVIGLQELDLTPWFLLHYSDVWPGEGSSLYQDLLDKKAEVGDSCMGILACSDSAPQGFLYPGTKLTSQMSSVAMVAKAFHVLELRLPDNSCPRLANMAIALLRAEFLTAMGQRKGEIFGIISELCSLGTEFQPVVHTGPWYHCDTESDRLMMRQRNQHV